MKKILRQSVLGCLQCGCNHKNVVFRLRNDIRRYTHWGICPETKKQILIKVED